MKVNHIKPLGDFPNEEFGSVTPKIFLAGSIEMGVADKWQQKVVDFLRASPEGDHVTVLDPRRDDWNASWKQEASNREFSAQVNWELDMIDSAHIVFFFFQPNTMSPISLLELGRVTSSMYPKTIVCCPHGFWRRGNVEIVCQRARVPMFADFGDALAELESCIVDLIV